MKNKIVIFGATGGTGQQLVKQALEQDDYVTAFVRNPDKLNYSHKNLTVLKGDVLNVEDVNNAIQNQDVVMCSLGMPAFDKSSLRTDGTKNIIRAMKNHGVDRLICQSSLGFGDSKDVLPWHMKYIIVPLILKNAFKDHECQEALIAESNLNWTIVRPGNMTNGKKTSRYKFGFNALDKIKLKISRADVADFMLKQINSHSFLHQKIGVSY